MSHKVFEREDMYPAKWATLIDILSEVWPKGGEFYHSIFLLTS